MPFNNRLRKYHNFIFVVVVIFFLENIKIYDQIIVRFYYIFLERDSSQLKIIWIQNKFFANWVNILYWFALSVLKIYLLFCCKHHDIQMLDVFVYFIFTLARDSFLICWVTSFNIIYESFRNMWTCIYTFQFYLASWT